MRQPRLFQTRPEVVCVNELAINEGRQVLKAKEGALCYRLRRVTTGHQKPSGPTKKAQQEPHHGRCQVLHLVHVQLVCRLEDARRPEPISQHKESVDAVHVVVVSASSL